MLIIQKVFGRAHREAKGDKLDIGKITYVLFALHSAIILCDNINKLRIISFRIICPHFSYFWSKMKMQKKPHKDMKAAK